MPKLQKLNISLEKERVFYKCKACGSKIYEPFGYEYQMSSFDSFALSLARKGKCLVCAIENNAPETMKEFKLVESK